MPSPGCALHLYIRNGVPYPGGTIGEAFYLLTGGDAGQHQDGAQTALQPGDDIGIHAVTDHHRVLRMSIEAAQGRAHHQWIRFANKDSPEHIICMPETN